VWICFNPDKRYWLEEAAARPCTFDSRRFELRSDVLRSNLSTTSACSASLKRIVSKKLDMGLQRRLLEG
jgi:hypothetical protein